MLRIEKIPRVEKPMSKSTRPPPPRARPHDAPKPLNIILPENIKKLLGGDSGMGLYALQTYWNYLHNIKIDPQSWGHFLRWNKELIAVKLGLCADIPYDSRPIAREYILAYAQHHSATPTPPEDFIKQWEGFIQSRQVTINGWVITIDDVRPCFIKYALANDAKPASAPSPPKNTTPQPLGPIAQAAEERARLRSRKFKELGIEPNATKTVLTWLNATEESLPTLDEATTKILQEKLFWKFPLRDDYRLAYLAMLDTLTPPQLRQRKMVVGWIELAHSGFLRPKFRNQNFCIIESFSMPNNINLTDADIASPEDELAITNQFKAIYHPPEGKSAILRPTPPPRQAPVVPPPPPPSPPPPPQPAPISAPPAPRPTARPKTPPRPKHVIVYDVLEQNQAAQQNPMASFLQTQLAEWQPDTNVNVTPVQALNSVIAILADERPEGGYFGNGTGQFANCAKLREVIDQAVTFIASNHPQDPKPADCKIVIENTSYGKVYALPYDRIRAYLGRLAAKTCG